MDFVRILKEAWKITWNKKNLWWLGFFAVLTEAGSASPTFYQLPTIPTSGDKAKAAAGEIWTGLVSAFSNPSVVTIATITILALLILIFYVSYSSKAGLILAVDEHKDKKFDDKSIAKKYFNEGKAFAWKIFLFNVIMALIVFFVLAVVLSPMIPLIIAIDQPQAVVMFVGLLIVAIAILMIFSIGMTIVKQLGERMIVLNKASALHAFLESIKMMFSNIGRVLLVWLISVALSIGYSLGSFLGLFLAGLLYFMTSALFYFVLKTPGLVFFSTTSGLIIIVAICIVVGGFSTFASSFWTLSYKELEEKK